MNIIAEIALICGVCLVGEGIAALLPVEFPASVIGLLLLMVLLFTGIVKDRHIRRVAEFIIVNMAFFFIPSCVGIMEQFPLLRDKLLAFLVICMLTTPVIYLTTAWTVRGVTALMARGRKAGERDG